MVWKFLHETYPHLEHQKFKQKQLYKRKMKRSSPYSRSKSSGVITAENRQFLISLGLEVLV